ncbi:hypothetical protein BDV39DRAFT_184302 [Aspergillus sergii]|uniref:Beta-ketoacyl synthase-like N-terminal domain-containing protein n=1 Tax=Aspergillus sergii TaxID=1034303 RepID=A0A5N6WN20_9EURO|nr:hypothetical protein BDV39DRAFT_184302 [Aspergillus sergii]
MNEPIAIVGLACRFPGRVTTPDELWQFLIGSKMAFLDIPPDRFPQSAFYHPDSKHNGTVECSLHI